MTSFARKRCRQLSWSDIRVVGTDIDRGIVGQRFNFNLGVEARYFVAKSWAINLEYRYQQISNANLGHRNLGINAYGPILGYPSFPSRIPLFGFFLPGGGVFLLLADHRRDCLQLIALA